MSSRAEFFNQLFIILIDRGLLALIAGGAGYWLSIRLERYKRGQQTAADLAKVRVNAFIEVFSTITHVQHLVTTFYLRATEAEQAKSEDEKARLWRQADAAEHAVSERIGRSPDLDKRTAFLIGKQLNLLAFNWFDALRDAISATRAREFDKAKALIAAADGLWDQLERYMPPLEEQQPAPTNPGLTTRDRPRGS